jgi:hypothetical protein
MIQLKLTDEEVIDIAEALDDPTINNKNKTKLLVIRMHGEGAKHGFIAKVLNLHANTITNHLREYKASGLPSTLEGMSHQLLKLQGDLKSMFDLVYCI